MKPLKLPLATLALLLALSACGKDAKNGDTSSSTSGSTSTASDNPTPAPRITGLAARCQNPLGLHDVPKEWKLIDGKELVDGKEGKWQLASGSIWGKIELEDRTDSALVDLVVFDRKRADGVSQTVRCADVGASGTFSLSFSPQDEIDTRDGAVKFQREIKTVLSRAGYEKTARLLNAPAGLRFAYTDEQSKRQEEELRRQGIDFGHAVHRISDTEFELRAFAAFPGQDGGKSRLTIHFSARFRLAR